MSGKKFFIFGNTGSGKSTLARHIASKEGCRHIDLDQYAWTEEVGERRELALSLRALNGKIKEGPTVVEGMYADLIAGSKSPQDALIWLDLPLEVCRQHCLSRPFEAHKWESAEKQDEFLPELLAFLETYPTREDALGFGAHEQLYLQHAGAKNRLTSEGEIEAFLSVSDWHL